MSFVFKKAIREQVSVILGLAGGTGSGKSWSAMVLAAGMSGGKPFAFIDSESGRGKMYADKFSFDHGDLHGPYTPAAYIEAIDAADKAGYPVVVVDSMSHEWGEILDMQEHELDRMAGDDWKKREACKMAAWVKPKMAHKKMVQRLLQVRAHLILCFRAEEKIEMVRGDDGKFKIIPKITRTGLDGWVPVTEKSLPFELTCSFLLTADAPGVPKPIKLPEMLKPMFPLDKPVDEASGQRVASWAAGGVATTTLAAPAAQAVNVEDLIDAIVDAPDMDALKVRFDAAKVAARVLKDNALLKRIEAAKDERKASLVVDEAL
jgi:AAA domain